MTYLGDFAVGATIDFMWNSSGADGASITRATNGTVSVYKGNSTTQSTTGVTDTEDFDALTGVHHCRITTASDGTFYAAGNDFMVVLSAATIDGKTVNAVLAHFSIQNRYQDKAGYGLADNAITGAKIATDAIDADALAASAVTEIQSGLATAAALATVQNYVDELESRLTAARAGYLDALNTGVPLSAAAVDAVLDDALEGAITMRQALRIMLASLAGKSAGGGTTTITYRDMADTKARITATVDVDRNRTAVVRDGT